MMPLSSRVALCLGKVLQFSAYAQNQQILGTLVIDCFLASPQLTPLWNLILFSLTSSEAH